MARSLEYTFMHLNIFMASDEDLLLQLELHSLMNADPAAIYVGDVTYDEWEFLLLTALAYRWQCFPASKEFFHNRLIQHLQESTA